MIAFAITCLFLTVIEMSLAGVLVGKCLQWHDKRLTELEKEIQRITKEMK